MLKHTMVLSTKSKKDISVPGIADIHRMECQFSIDTKQKYLYTALGTTYTLSPFNEIEKSVQNTEIISIQALGDVLYVLREKTLEIYKSQGFNSIKGNYKNSMLKPVEYRYLNSILYPDSPDFPMDENQTYIGVLFKDTIEIYDATLRIIKMFTAQNIYSTEETLLIFDGNIVKCYVIGKNPFIINMPEYIVSGVHDSLFRWIFCSTKTGVIYRYSLVGDRIEKMENHAAKTNLMILPNYLYSYDSQRISVWDPKTCVLLGYADLDASVDSLEIFIEGNRIYGNSPIHMN